MMSACLGRLYHVTEEDTCFLNPTDEDINNESCDEIELYLSKGELFVIIEREYDRYRKGKWFVIFARGKKYSLSLSTIDAHSKMVDL